VLSCSSILARVFREE
jgi:hypothetical protein